MRGDGCEGKLAYGRKRLMLHGFSKLERFILLHFEFLKHLLYSIFLPYFLCRLGQLGGECVNHRPDSGNTGEAC